MNMINKRCVAFRVMLFILIMFAFDVNYYADDTSQTYTNILKILSNSKDITGEAKSGQIIDGVLYVDAAEIKFIKPRNLYFRADIETPKTATIFFSKTGKLSYITGVGTYVFRSVFDKDGNVAEAGTVYGMIDEADVKDQIEVAKKRKGLADKSYNYLNKMTKANEVLAEKHLITSFDMEQSQIALLTNLLQYESQTREVDQIASRYKDEKMYTQYSGIVKNVYAQSGDTVQIGQEAMELIQMTPITLKIKCLNYFVKTVPDDLEAYVYDDINSLPIKAKVEFLQNDNYHVYIILENEPVIATNLTSLQANMPKVFEVFPVKNLMFPNIEVFFQPEKRKKNIVYTVPVDSIRHDEKGYFVFRAEHIDNQISDSHFPVFFKIKKVYVEPEPTYANIDYKVGVSTKVQVIKENPDLNLGDIVVGASEPGLKDGDTVSRISLKWKFYPGEILKAEIPKLTPNAIYIPKECIVFGGINDVYIYIYDHDRLRLVKVEVIGCFENFVALKNDPFILGKKAIIINDPEMYKLVYDGRKVKILNTQEAPDFMEMEHSFDFSPVNIEESEKDGVNKGKTDYSNLIKEKAKKL